jgi:hypothetical protein
MLYNPYLNLTSSDKKQAQELLDISLTKNNDIRLLYQRISDHLYFSDKLKHVLKTSLESKKDLYKVMQQMNITSYSKFLEILLVLLESKISIEKKNYNITTKKLLLKICDACDSITEVYCDFDIEYIEKMIELVKNIRQKVVNGENSTEKKPIGILAEVTTRLLKIEKELECFLVGKKIVLKNMADETLREKVNGLAIRNMDELLLDNTSDQRKQLKENLLLVRQRLALQYKINLEFNAISTISFPPCSCEGRVDFTSQNVITIDSSTTISHDDAFYLEYNQDGTYTLYVHIAHPNELLRNRPDIKEEAIKRGENLCSGDFSLLLLPGVISKNLGSLIRGNNRYVITHKFKINRDGEILSYQCLKGVIVVKTKLTYVETDNILKSGAKDTQLEYMLNHMLELATILKSKRNQNNLNGKNDKLNSNDIVKEFSALINQNVATIFAENDYPCIYIYQEGNNQNPLSSNCIYHYEKIGHNGLGGIPYTRVSSPLNYASDFVVGGDLTEAFLLPEHPTDQDHYFYQEYVKRVVRVLNEERINYKMFIKEYRRQYNRYSMESKNIL